MRSAGGYVWVDSPLHRAPAAAKLAGLVVAVAIVVLATSPLELGLAAAGVAALVATSRVGWRVAARGLWGMRWFLLVILAMNALLFSAEDPLLSLGPLRLTAAGVAQGVRVVVRTALVVVLGTLLGATTRPQQITAGVRAALRPLERVGVPTEVAALAVGVTMQFVPTLIRESRQLMRAQTLRCGNVTSGSIMRRAVSYVRLLVPVFVAAFRRADELAVAMEARGYRLSGGRRPGEESRP